MLAVLADAVNVLRGYRASPYRERRNPFKEALSWVFAKRGIISPLSFEHVCDALGMDAESLRRRLSELVSEHGRNSRKLRLKEIGRRANITRVRRR